MGLSTCGDIIPEDATPDRSTCTHGINLVCSCLICFLVAPGLGAAIFLLRTVQGAPLDLPLRGDVPLFPHTRHISPFCTRLYFDFVPNYTMTMSRHDTFFPELRENCIGQ